MELAIFFISGIQLTLLALLLYQYGTILKRYKVVKTDYDIMTNNNKEWVKTTTNQLSDIQTQIDTSDFADAATFNREITAFSERLNAVEVSINTLAKKEDNDVKTLKDSIREIKIYIQGVISDRASQKGY
jgi:hypothetical protein